MECVWTEEDIVTKTMFSDFLHWEPQTNHSEQELLSKGYPEPQRQIVTPLRSHPSADELRFQPYFCPGGGWPLVVSFSSETIRYNAPINCSLGRDLTDNCIPPVGKLTTRWKIYLFWELTNSHALPHFGTWHGTLKHSSGRGVRQPCFSLVPILENNRFYQLPSKWGWPATLTLYLPLKIVYHLLNTCTIRVNFVQATNRTWYGHYSFVIHWWYIFDSTILRVLLSFVYIPCS